MSAIFKKYAVSGIFLLSLVFVCFFHFSGLQGNDEKLTRFQQKLKVLEQEAEKGLTDLYNLTSSGLYSAAFEDPDFNSSELFRSKGIVYLIYDRDSLVFWSDYSAAVENYRNEVCLDNPLARLRNGWYEVIQHPANQRGSKNLIALLLIKNEYSYQNKFLFSGFPDWFGLPPGTQLREFSFSDNSNVISSAHNKPLFNLRFPAGSQFSSRNKLIVFPYILLIITGFLLIFQVLSVLLRNRKKSFILLIFFLSALSIRVLMMVFGLPSVLYDSFLYDATLYGDSSSVFFGRLGDLFIHAVLLLFLVLMVTRHATKFKLNPNVALLVFPVLAFFSAGLNSLISGLVLNSHISFRLNEVFSLSPVSLIALFSVGLIFLSFYLMSRFSIDVVLRSVVKWNHLYVIILIGLVFHVLFLFFKEGIQALPEAWIWGLFFLLMLLRKSDWRSSFSYALPFIMFFSLLSVYLFSHHEQRREIETRKVYAQDLSNQRDDVAENLFVDVSAKIKKDEKLKKLIFSPPVNSIDLEQRLRQQYFSGYWEKFDILLSVVDSACSPLLRTENPVHGNNTYFDQQIEASGVTTFAEGLFFIDDSTGKNRYIIRLKVEPPWTKKLKPAILYAELSQKIANEVFGFPELLLDKKVNTKSKLNDYSYAVYNQNRLIRKSGKYNYGDPFTWNAKGNFTLFSRDGFSHLIFSSGVTRVVMSLPDDDWKGRLSRFSGFFSFFSFLLMLLFLFREIFSLEPYFRSSLNFRIQVLLVSVVLFALLFFGWGTYFVMKRQYESQSLEALSQLSRSVTEDVQSKLAAANQLDENYRDYVGYLFKKVSTVFLSDVSLFDLKGNLIASSQPRLFDEGIISRKMNPRAFGDSLLFSGPRIILNENIGQLNFNSSYQRFFNRDGKHIGYINLPYFAKKEQQEKEISMSVAAWVNIYVVLFAVSLIVALLISNLVTKPLRVLQQKFSSIRFGSQNEMIEWKGSDEISALVDEYNRMVTQLEDSAERLAKSEREGAWREMAKQVAHEIKNPLTPMKLNIQHLQRTLDSGSPDDLKERVRKLSQILIEQIDTLSSIASEFSSFAQMPKSNFAEVNISEVLNHVLQLFSKEENHSLSKTDNTNGMVKVWVDKDQCIRVFTNLLKNAIQSVPEGRSGRIQVEMDDAGSFVEIKIKDNGSGIPEELHQRIFTPNFSTKTGGMGLGLAIVKNILDSFRGSIHFETVLGTGTTFVVQIPKIQSGSV